MAEQVKPDEKNIPQQPPTGVRLRAIIVATIIIPFDNYWVLMMEKVREGPYPTTISIFPNVIFLLLALTALNALVARYNRKLALNNAELLLIYSMSAIAAALAGHDFLPTLVAMMTYPFVFTTPENQWGDKFLPHLPKWLSVTDPEAGKMLWLGRVDLFADGYWKLWVVPIAWWVAFVMALAMVMMCINTIVRKRWTDQERLTFPIIQLPLAMTDPTGLIWKNRGFWIGFSISFGIVFINGLATYIPAIPTINVTYENHDLFAGVTQKPWTGFGWTPYSFYPFVIGLGILLPTDLLFSCWFFYWFWKLQKVFVIMFGWDANPQVPYVANQAWGGYAAIALTMLWTSRGYLKQVWRRILGKPSELDDSNEAISYRSAFMGIILGIAFLSLFMISIGLSPILAVAAFFIYFLIALSITRIRAELGPPVHDLGFGGPNIVIPDAIGTDKLSNSDLVGFGYFWWFNRAYRCHPMPIGMEGLKMAHSAGASQKRFFWGLLFAVLVGTLATFWVYVYLGYKIGFETGMNAGGVYASGGFRHLDRLWNRMPDMASPNWGINIAVLGGVLFATFLWYMHIHVLGWPFHPIGYAITASYQINTVWFPLFLAWLIKTQMLRWGGLKMYRRSIPFFLGLMLGEMTMGCLWSLFGIALNIPYYNFYGH